jgi:hypothetical protein
MALDVSLEWKGKKNFSKYGFEYVHLEGAFSLTLHASTP